MIMLDCDFNTHTTGYLNMLVQRAMQGDKKIIIGRYISRYKSSWKVTNLVECDAIKAAHAQLSAVGGFCLMWLIYEDDGKPRSAGQGASDAVVTRSWISWLNWPRGGLIAYTSDEDGPVAPVCAATGAYFNGLKDSNGFIVKRGLYASGIVLEAAYGKGLIDVRWPTMSLGFTGTREALRKGEYEIDQLVDVNFSGKDIDPDVIRNGLDPLTLGFAVPDTGSDTPALVA